MNKPIIILGSGGHAKVLMSILLLNSAPIIGITDNDESKYGKDIYGIPVIGNDDIILNYPPDSINLVNAIGSIDLPTIRMNIYNKFKERGYNFTSVIHPSAVIASDAIINEGAQIMAGTIIQPGSSIGVNTIINTRSSIDHDCHIGNHVHIAPGVTFSGGVTIGEQVHIGTGTVVIQNIKVGSGSIIGAGAVVLRDIPEEVTAFGVPAQIK